MAIITRFIYKIKLFLSDYYEEVGISFIIIFVGASSFFLGKYSVLSEKGNKDSVLFKNNNDMTSLGSGEVDSGQVRLSSPAIGVNDEQSRLSSSADSVNDGQVVASKIGKRYYPLTCAGASRISDKNKIFFASVALAEKAGLTLAVGCK